MTTQDSVQSFNFGIGESGSLLLTRGWRSPEIWGVKNTDPICEIRFPGIISAEEGSISFNFWCECLSETSVHVNGAYVAVWHASDSYSLRTLGNLDSTLLAPSAPVSVQFQAESGGSLSLVSTYLQGGKFTKTQQHPRSIECFHVDTELKAPLFITGIPRSGTSILYKIISHALGTENPALIESFFFYWAFSRFEDKWAGDCSCAFLGNDLSGHFNQTRAEFDMPLDYYDTLALTRHYYQMAATRYGAARVVDKTPGHIFYWRAILDTFPEAKIIFCYRSAVDVFASMKKRSRASQSIEPNASESKWLSMNCDAFVYSYTEHMQAARNAIAQNRGSVLVVEYDRLIMRDATLLGEISNFIGCLESDLNAALDTPLPGSVQDSSPLLLNGRLAENRINYGEYLSGQELEVLKNLQRIFR